MLTRELRIEKFVAKLWQHARLKALHSNSGILRSSSRQLKLLYDAIGEEVCFVKIGEALTAHVLNYVVQNYARESCITCRRFPDGCSKSDAGCCDEYSQDAEAEAEARVQLYNAIFVLDGVYCFNAGEMLSVVAVFLDELTSSHD